jgi:hypothetical protein
MAIQDRYHIRFRNRRTTITVDRVVSELLAPNWAYRPRTPQMLKLIAEIDEFRGGWNTLHNLI